MVCVCVCVKGGRGGESYGKTTTSPAQLLCFCVAGKISTTFGFVEDPELFQMLPVQ